MLQHKGIDDITLGNAGSSKRSATFQWLFWEPLHLRRIMFLFQNTFLEFHSMAPHGRQNRSGCSGFGRTSFSQGKNKIPFLQKASNKQKC